MEIASSYLTVISGNGNVGSWKAPRGLQEEAAQAPASTCVVVTAGFDTERNDGDTRVFLSRRSRDCLTPLDVSVIQGMTQWQITVKIVAIKKLSSHCHQFAALPKYVKFHGPSVPSDGNCGLKLAHKSAFL